MRERLTLAKTISYAEYSMEPAEVYNESHVSESGKLSSSGTSHEHQKGKRPFLQVVARDGEAVSATGQDSLDDVAGPEPILFPSYLQEEPSPLSINSQEKGKVKHDLTPHELFEEERWEESSLEEKIRERVSQVKSKREMESYLSKNGPLVNEMRKAIQEYASLRLNNIREIDRMTAELTGKFYQQLEEAIHSIDGTLLEEEWLQEAESKLNPFIYGLLHAKNEVEALRMETNVSNPSPEPSGSLSATTSMQPEEEGPAGGGGAGGGEGGGGGAGGGFEGGFDYWYISPERKRRNPEDIEDLAVGIMFSDPQKWGSLMYVRERYESAPGERDGAIEIVENGTTRILTQGEHPMFDTVYIPNEGERITLKDGDQVIDEEVGASTEQGRVRGKTTEIEVLEMNRYIMHDGQKYEVGTYEIRRIKGTNDVVDIDPRDIKGKITEVFNKDNFLRWDRERVVTIDMQDPFAPQKFYSEVDVSDPNWLRGHFPMGQLMKEDRWWLLKNGEKVTDLQDATVDVLSGAGNILNGGKEYNFVMPKESELVKYLDGVYSQNTWTRESGGISYLRRIFEMPQNLSDHGEYDEVGGDIKVGSAIRSMTLHWYYSTDFEKLVELYGEDYTFFKRSYWENALSKVAKQTSFKSDLSEEELRASGDWGGLVQYDINTFFKGDEDTMDIFKRNNDGSFVLENGKKVVDPQKAMEIVKKINIFVPQRPDADKLVVRDVLKNGIGEFYGLQDDKDNLNFAELIAFRICYPTGINARNDIVHAGMDAWVKWQRTFWYRNKQLDGDRGGSAGNYYNMQIFRQLGADFFTGIDTLTGNSILQLMEEAEKEVRRDSENNRGVRTQKILDTQKKLRFSADSQRQFLSNQIKNAAGMYESLTDLKEISFQKYSKLVEGRLEIDEAAFSEDLKGGVIKPLRYMISTWKQLDFGEEERTMIPIINEKGEAKEGEYKTVTRLEAYFGEATAAVFRNDKAWDFGDALKGRIDSLSEADSRKAIEDYLSFLVNPNPEKDEDKGKADKTAKKLASAYSQEFIGKDFSELTSIERKQLLTKLTETKGMLSIGEAKVVNDVHRTHLFKYAVAFYAGTQLLAHRKNVSRNYFEKYDIIESRTFLRLLDSIPGKAIFDEDDLRNTRVDGNFFGKDMYGRDYMEFIKALSNTTTGKLWTGHLILLLLGAMREAFGESTEELTKGIAA